MAGLIDIAPVVEVVDVRGKPVEVTGVDVEGVGRLLWRFPELRKMVETRTLDVEALLTLSSDVVAAIFAAGTGMPGNEAAEAGAKNLTLGEKVELLGAILKVTMPRGVGPFVEALNRLSGVGAAPSDTAPDTKSRKRSSG